MDAPPATAPVRTIRVPRNARRTVRRLVLWPSWLLFATITLFFAAGFSVALWAEYLPFFFSLVVFGLPHGAVDHLAVPRLSGRKPWPWPALAVGALYLSLGGLYLALWSAAPVAAFVLFIVLTWFHWGQGDLHTLVSFVSSEAGYPAGQMRRALTLLVRGGLPMLVPLLVFPETYHTVADSTVGLFISGGSDGFSWIFGPSFRFLVGAAFALFAMGVLVSNYASAKKRGELGAWKVDAAETALLALYFSLVPPVLAVGLYFCLWHAPRHVARLVLLDRASTGALETGRIAPALVRFARDASPLTGVALVLLLLGLYLVMPGSSVALLTLLSLYLVLISALTLPHVVVATFMDLRQGLWRDMAASEITPERKV